MIDFSKLSGSVSLRNSALATAAVMALTVGGAASAAGPIQGVALGVVKAQAAQSKKVSPDAVLYDQTASPDANAITSQNFEASFDVYDNSAADDFVIPAGVKWKITKVVIPGAYYNGVGPMASVDVTFYKNTGGLPGAAVCTAAGVVPTDDGLGNIEAKVKCTLKKGKYFVGAVANLDFLVGGQWGWGMQTVGAGAPAAWQNPLGGFGVGCTTWSNMAACLGQTSTDMSFRLDGSVIVLP